jgi:hypothetical protein
VVLLQRDIATRVEYEATVLNKHGTTSLCFARSVPRFCKETDMPAEFSDLERRLGELSERLARLQPLSEKPRNAFDQDPYLSNSL